jgi:ribosomal subunit interface protein
MDHSGAVEALIREKAQKLEEYSGEIVACKVMVETPHHKHSHGNLQHVRIELVVPGKEIVVARDPREQHAHEDVYVAIRDAFNAIEEQLRTYTQKRHAHVKRHSAPQ